MLEIDEIFEGRYRIVKALGHGGMGTVFLAVDTTDDSKWAIKETKITDFNRKLLFSEAEIMERVNYPAFPKIRDKKEINGFLYIVMEYIEGHTLEDEIAEGGRIDEKQIVDWFKQICCALIYLHSLDSPIVYRDFKPSNLMLEESGRIRIIDLGIAQEYRGDGARVDVAALTRGYAAPEQYDKRYKLDVRTDIYALAVTIHYLLTGKNPNEPPYEFVPVRKLRRDLSYSIEFIIKKCLQPNPDRRYPNAALLLEDIERIGTLDRSIRSQVRLRRIVASVLAVAAIAASAAVYTINFRARTGSIDRYYSFIEHAEKAESLEDGLRDIQQAINLSPENPEAYIACVELYISYRCYEDAYTYINDVIIERFPDIYNNADFLELIQKIEKLQP